MQEILYLIPLVLTAIAVGVIMTALRFSPELRRRFWSSTQPVNAEGGPAPAAVEAAPKAVASGRTALVAAALVLSPQMLIKINFYIFHQFR